jgi:hypothetical protein
VSVCVRSTRRLLTEEMFGLDDQKVSFVERVAGSEEMAQVFDQEW